MGQSTCYIMPPSDCKERERRKRSDDVLAILCSHRHCKEREKKAILCFYVLLLYYESPFLDLGKNIVKWLGQCFLPELAN